MNPFLIPFHFVIVGIPQNNTVVLTAAHCIGTMNGRVLVGAVRAGSTSVGNAQWRAVTSKMIKHPKYTARTNSNDLMMFKIQPVTKKHLKPIGLNFNGSLPKAGQGLKVIGMGALNPAGTQYGYQLRQTVVKAMSHKVCNSRYGGWMNGKTMLCAANFQGARSDSCYGDSGGPLFTPWKNPSLVGIVSFGANCADKYYPGVYARVSGNIQWIKNNICRISRFKPGYCRRKLQQLHASEESYDTE